MPNRLILFLVAAIGCKCICAQQSDTETDLFALELVQFDLQQAKRMMVVYDRNEDGAIDKDEQERLSWKKDVATFDLNRDGKLTHLEMAVREAKVRHDSDITQFDVNNVNTFLRRYDRNNNGQLDPDEIEGGWPSNPEYELFDSPKTGQLPKSLLKQADRNDDQRLGLDELAKHFAAQRERESK